MIAVAITYAGSSHQHFAVSAANSGLMQARKSCMSAKSTCMLLLCKVTGSVCFKILACPPINKAYRLDSFILTWNPVLSSSLPSEGGLDGFSQAMIGLPTDAQVLSVELHSRLEAKPDSMVAVKNGDHEIGVLCWSVY